MREFPTVVQARLPLNAFSAGELTVKQGGVFSCWATLITGNSFL